MSLSFALHDTAASTATEIYEPIASSNSPSSRQRGWQLPMDNSHPNSGTRLLPLRRNEELAKKVSAVVLSFTAKYLGRVAGRTEEAGKSWRQGRACPDLASAINMAQEIPAIKWLIYREIERGMPEGIHSPRLQVEAMALLSEVASGNGEHAERARKLLSGDAP